LTGSWPISTAGWSPSAGRCGRSSTTPWSRWPTATPPPPSGLPAIDQAVDRLNDRVFAQIKKSNEPTAPGWAPQLVLLARFLERLGDQAVDVGEQVRFIVTGEVRELLPPKAARIPADAGRS
jgi:hypothetical protein